MKPAVDCIESAVEHEAEQPDLAPVVRDALRHLHDPVYLRTHRLADLLGGEVGLPSRGTRLHQILLDAIAALRPGSGSIDVRASRRHELLRLRYVEALEISEVSARLGMSRREYTRQHRLALDAVVLLLRDSMSQPARSGSRTTIPDVTGDLPGAGRLPMPVSTFVGREKAMAEVLRLITSVRLVTFTGPPGTGKTRLAVQLAAELAASSGGDGSMFAGGIFFVPLASIADPGLVVSSIAQAVGVRESGDRTLFKSLEDRLSRHCTLIILDNFEHVLPAAPIVAQLVTACPKLVVLITSREALHLSGEHEYTVLPLSVPRERRLGELDQLAENEAVRLYVERASAKAFGFRLTDQNAAAVSELCRRLDGLPLAIELAAARNRVFPPQALLDWLGEPGGSGTALGVLAGGAKDLPIRQQTLGNAIDWSYRLLTQDEQRLFAQLAVFAGGWTLEDAQAICILGGLDVVDGMISLIDKSLVQAGETTGGEHRFGMLETIREFAAARLRESGENEETRTRHASYFMRLGQEAYIVFSAAAQPSWLDRLEREHNNMRAALSWLTVQGMNDAALQLVAGLWWFWMIRGHISEGRHQIGRVLASTCATLSAERAEVLMGASHLAMMQGDFADAETQIAAAVDLARQVGDGTVLGDALMTHGLCALRRGNVQQAKDAYQESLPLAHALGRVQRIAIATRALGAVAQREGDLVRAMRLIEESVAIHRELNDVWELSTDYLSLGLLSAQRGDLGRAEGFFRDSLQLALQIREIDKIAYLLEALAGIAVNKCDYVQAARLLAAAESVSAVVETDTFRKTVEVVFPENERELRREWEMTIRTQLREEWAVIREAAEGMSLTEVVASALRSFDLP